MRYLTLLLLVTHLTASPAPAKEAEGRDVPPREIETPDMTWTRLQFEARKLFFTATTRVTLVAEETSAAAAAWIASPEGRVRTPAGPEVLRLELDALFAGRHSVDQVWLDPTDAAAIQRSKRQHGKSGYTKDYRYTAEGTFMHRLAPIDDREARDGPDAWSKVEDRFYAWNGDGCRVVTEPSVLFYLLSTFDIDEGLRICVFSDKRLLPVEIRADGRETLDDAGYVVRTGGRDVPVDRTEVFRVAVRPQDDDGEFEFLGLEGDLVVLLEVERRLPIRVRGRIPHFGRVEVRLTEAELRVPDQLSPDI